MNDDVLQPRFIRNDGSNEVMIEQDPKFIPYLLRNKQNLISKTVLTPNQKKYFPHWYAIVTSSDGKPVKVTHFFDGDFQ